MISISDCLCKLGYIMRLLKLINVILIILTSFACTILRACLQNILIFLVIIRAKFSIFWPFIKKLRSNYQITEKKINKPRLLIVLI